VLLRRVIGDALRARRQDQHRTLREISTAANVSLGYLSEIERGQKEASSELLASICEALGSQLSEVLREASDSLARVERTGVPAGAPARRALADGGLADGGLADGGLADGGLADGGLADGGLADGEASDRALAGGALPDRATATGAVPDGALADTALPDAALGGPGHTGADEPGRRAGGRAEATDGTVSVSVRRDGPLRTTLHAVRTDRAGWVVRAGSRG
jgi:transcriptional regulator with XRE-family HTH domain